MIIGFFRRFKKISRYLFLDEYSSLPVVEMRVEFPLDVNSRASVVFLTKYTTSEEWSPFFTCCPLHAERLAKHILDGVKRQEKFLRDARLCIMSSTEEYLDYDVRENVTE